MAASRIGRLTAALALACAAHPLPAGAQEEGTIVARDTVRFEGPAIERLREAGGIDADAFTLQRITYLSDGLRVQGYLAEPLEGDSLPAIVVNRGGNGDFGAWTDLSAGFFLGLFAQAGYVAVASQYGGVAGGEGRDEFGGRDVNDVLNLLPLLDAHPRVDAGRIGMYGHSRGGMMTYLALTRTDRIRGAVVGGAPARLIDESRPEMEQVFAMRIPEWSTDREAAIRTRSPVEWPERIHAGTPILIVHGTSDWRVPPADALDMARALLDARRPFRLVMFEGADHGIREFQAELDALMLEWFGRWVRDGAPLPDLEPHGR